MSALPHAGGPGGRELFGGGGQLPGSVGFEYDQKESRGNYGVGKKKRRAPAPPSTGLGGYKPKILSDDGGGIVSVSTSPASPTSPSSRSSASIPRDSSSLSSPSDYYSDVDGRYPHPLPHPQVNGQGRALIMGDKDVPITVHDVDVPPESSRLLELDVSELTLTSDGQGTDNPLFRLEDSPRHGQAGGSRHLHNGQRGVDTAHGGDAFHVESSSATEVSANGHLDHSDSESEAVMTFYASDSHHPHHHPGLPNGEGVGVDGEPEGVYIPAPDYEEEEKTLELEEELDDVSPRGGKQVYKEYYGEDFGLYLSDEELSVDQQMLSRSGRRPSGQLAERRVKTEGKRSQYRKKDVMLGAGGGKGHKKAKGFSGSHSLRDFSFADSKFGTVKGGRGGSVASPLDETAGSKEADLFVTTGTASYEQFLRRKSGEDLGQVLREQPHHHLPPRLARHAQSKDSLWKKLTWKFKKQDRNNFDVSTAM